MVRRIDCNGLNLSVIKLNGRLDLRFSTDVTYTAQYSLQGTDTEDTMQMEYVRESAAGQPVISLGLEMFLEDVDGFLEVRFEGLVGSTLAFEFDGREFREVEGLDEPLPGNISTDDAIADSSIARKSTRDAKMQTLDQGTRHARTQTVPATVTDQGIQTKPKCMVSIGIQAPANINPVEQTSQLFPNIVDLIEQDVLAPFIKKELRSPSQEKLAVAHTFTNAVETVFQTFNEPRDPYRLKRQAEPAANYRAYKHIFIEGYRNGDGKDEEGRLHVDLVHHVLLWESYDDYEGGARLTLDRLDLPRCTCFFPKIFLSLP
jgi:hypothetical protein